ncbi:hypothetical protein ACWEO2_10590 [Nocardia sp. NPDC004278]
MPEAASHAGMVWGVVLTRDACALFDEGVVISQKENMDLLLSDIGIVVALLGVLGAA